MPVWTLQKIVDVVDLARMAYPMWLGAIETTTVVAALGTYAVKQYRRVRNIPECPVNVEVALEEERIAESGCQTRTHWHPLREKYYYGYATGYTRTSEIHTKPVLVRTQRELAPTDTAYEFLRKYNNIIARNEDINFKNMYAEYREKTPQAMRYV